MSKTQHNPWFWIPSLSAAEEIPSAVVTFVSLLMFLQFGADYAMASLYSALLFIPWVMKSYLRSKVRNAGYFKYHIHIVEVMVFAILFWLAYYLNDCRVDTLVLFLFLFVLAFMCAWHELLARMYYNRMLYPRQQRLYNRTKIFASATTVILTYGVLIMFVGFFEVVFRGIQKAWAMETYLVAGVFLLFTLMNFAIMPNPRIHNPYRYESLIGAFKNELHIVERIRRKPDFWKIMLSFVLLMLPQSCVLTTRVFFLMAAEEDGGLNCSVQDVGFALGTIGVIAFFIGLLLGRGLIDRYGSQKTLWWFALPLTLSPVSYALMAHNPLPGNVMAICALAFVNQFCFGLGLNICMAFVHYISNERYRNTINYLYIPFVAMSMVIPMALSGWAVMHLTFPHFFLLSSSFAPVALLLMKMLNINHILTDEK